MIRRWLAAWRRRREDLPAALRRALDAERARGGDVVSGPADLGDLLSGRLAVPPAGPATPEYDAALDELDRQFRSRSVPPSALRTGDPVWRAGHLPLTWRQRRDLIEQFERIVNGETS